MWQSKKQKKDKDDSGHSLNVRSEAGWRCQGLPGSDQCFLGTPQNLDAVLVCGEWRALCPFCARALARTDQEKLASAGEQGKLF